MVQPPSPSAAGRVDRVLDCVVVLLATWTVSYHVCLVLRLGTTWALGLEVAALLAWAGVVRHCPDVEAVPAKDARPSDDSSERRTRPWLVATLVAAAIAGVGMAVSAPWTLVWLAWLVSGAAGTAWAVLHRTRSTLHASDRRWGGREGARTSVPVALVWAVGLAIASVWFLRPNPDDLFYLNLSQWVAEHGTFPIRDTLFANLTYPMSNWPPVASYDGLVGTIAHLTGSHAAQVEYVVVTPVATGLSVLALWRLLRAWGVRQVSLSLSVALVFLLFDGTASYGTPGNLFLTRLWQGKVILLCLLVPLMLVHALRYVDRPNRARLGWLFTCGAASVGLSTTAIFLTPLVAAAGMAPLALRSRRSAVFGFVALAAYPLGAGVATKLLGGRSADDFGARRLYRFDGSWIGHEVFLTGILALVAVLAVLLGTLLVPDRDARVTTGVLVFFTGVVFIPGLTRMSYDLVGLGPTLWRVSWGVCVAGLVGVAAVRSGTWLAHRLGGADRTRRHCLIELGAAAVSMVLLATLGAPIWAIETGTVMRAPFHWDRSYSSRSVVGQVLADLKPGELFLGPDPLSITVAVTTTAVKTVAPRDYYMYYLRHDPSFHYRERLALVRFVNHKGHWDPGEIRRALGALPVQVACVPIQDLRRYRAIRLAGYEPLLTSSYYRCLHKT
jgi:hypothetical protein